MASMRVVCVKAPRFIRSILRFYSHYSPKK